MITKIWRISSVFVLACLLSTNLFAQVKEVKSLGKTWYLHGVDFRIKTLSTSSTKYYSTIIKNANFNDDAAYRQTYDTSNFYSNRIGVNPFTEISVGAVFRPLHRARFAFLRQTELAHNFIFQRTSNIFYAYGNVYDYAIRTNHFGYNPRLMVSTPRFLEYLKLYASADAYVYLPLSNFVYTSPPEKYLPNGGGDYSTTKEYQWTDRMLSNFLKYGGGYSIGLKMYVTCKWNFHIEGSSSTIISNFGKNTTSDRSNFNGIQFGLRYKFGTEEEDDKVDEGGRVFW